MGVHTGGNSSPAVYWINYMKTQQMPKHCALNDILYIYSENTLSIAWYVKIMYERFLTYVNKLKIP